jgi:signal transduction histidine kinase/ligand-binding sensor domain-containing protein
LKQSLSFLKLSIMALRLICLLYRRFGAALFLALSAATAAAGPGSAWLTRAWQTEEGLPNTYVNSVVQGEDGFIWIATPVTVARFDGVRFTRFPFRNEDDSEPRYQGGRQYQAARRIVPSRNGGLYITPVRGPAVYLSPDYSQVSTPATGLPPGSSPATSFEDRHGDFWLAAAGKIVRIHQGEPTQFGEAEGVPRGNVYSLTEDGAGMVWLVKGNVGSGSIVKAFKNGRFEQVTVVNGMARLAATRSNGVWLANPERLFKCDASGALEDYGPFQPQNSATEVQGLLEDHAGAVWIGTDGNGLFRRGGLVQTEASAEARVELVPTSYPKILCLMEDRENNLWVGTGGGGLDRISPRGVQMEGVASGSSLMGIQSVCEDAEGTMWGATQNGLLVCRHGEAWSPAPAKAPGRVTCVAADRSGTVWIGTQDRALHCWREHRFTTWDDSAGVAGNSIVALLPSSKEDLWIAEFSLNGVQCLHEGKLRSLTFAGDTGRINAMAEDAAGRIWIGTSTGLLLLADGDRLVDETSRTGASARTIRSLYAAPDGALWIGYGGWGLGRLKDNHFASLRAEQGLPDNYISQMIGDDQGWLWFGAAEHGIFKIRQQQLEQALDDNTTRLRPILYGRNEGLLGMEVFGYTPGACRSRDGRLWIPMRKALAVVDPKILHENPRPPKVILTQVLLDGLPIASYGGVAFTQQLANLKTLKTPLRLPPRHRRLDIDFAALSFNAPENVHFQYQLEGVDNNWTEAEPQRRVTYSRLAARDYRFRVRACNADGLWSEASSPLALTVTPFVWQRWWFQLAVVVLFTSAVVAGVRYVSFRRLRLELRLLEQQAVLDKERTRIARDLHDDLGCSLTHVALLLEMNEQQAANGNGPNGKSQVCSPMVRNVIKSVDEIVWAINPRNDNLQYLADYIVEFSVNFLHAAGIRPRVDLPERIPERAVSPEVRHNLFLVVKEALNNIVRHADASEARFRLTTTNAELSIVIEDNGCGFERPPESASADGLRNMRQRMEEIGGGLQIESKPGKGTKVSLSYPWPRVESANYVS